MSFGNMTGFRSLSAERLREEKNENLQMDAEQRQGRFDAVTVHGGRGRWGGHPMAFSG